MRFAIISDIHGNHGRAGSCGAGLGIGGSGEQSTRPATWLCLVRILVECIEMLRQNGWASVRGNTDRMIADLEELAAVASLDPETGVGKIVAWTRDQLGRELVESLGALPPSITIESRAGRGSVENLSWDASER